MVQSKFSSMKINHVTAYALEESVDNRWLPCVVIMLGDTVLKNRSGGKKNGLSAIASKTSEGISSDGINVDTCFSFEFILDSY